METTKLTKEQIEAERERLAKELEDAEVRLEAIEREERLQREEEERAERDRKAEQARIDRVEKYAAHASKLVAALKAAGMKDAYLVAYDKHSHSLPVVRVLPKGTSEHDFAVTFETVYSNRHSYRARENGVRITVGSYGNKKSFPMKADGTFSYEKIAIEVYNRYQQEVQVNAREREQERLISLNRPLILPLLKKYSKLSNYGPFDGRKKRDPNVAGDYDSISGFDITPSKYKAGQLVVSYNGNLHLTGEQADRLIGFIINLKKEGKGE